MSWLKLLFSHLCYYTLAAFLCCGLKNPLEFLQQCLILFHIHFVKRSKKLYFYFICMWNTADEANCWVVPQTAESSRWHLLCQHFEQGRMTELVGGILSRLVSYDELILTLLLNTLVSAVHCSDSWHQVVHWPLKCVLETSDGSMSHLLLSNNIVTWHRGKTGD